MKHLYFIRGSTTLEDEEYFESKTAVVVYGDCPGYEYFRACLQRAKDARRSIPLRQIPESSNSMCVVITPASRDYPPGEMRLKMIERIVFRPVGPRMELVIHGTPAAYEEIADTVHQLMHESIDRLNDHAHIDDWNNPWVVRCPVALNLRGPLKRWSEAGLGDYVLALKDQRHFLPEEVSYLRPWKYRLPQMNDNPFLRLDR